MVGSLRVACRVRPLCKADGASAVTTSMRKGEPMPTDGHPMTA